MKLIAITGSIGCGKTTLATIVKELGYAVYDMERPQGYYGNLTDDIATSLKEEQAWNDPSEPVLSM